MRRREIEWAEQDVVGADEWPPAAASTGAVANTAVLVRWTAWVLLIGGVVLGFLALVNRPATARASVPVAMSAPDVASALGPAGFAQLYVDAYVAAGEGSQNTLTAFYPAAAQAAFTGKPGTFHAGQTATVRMTTVAPGYWSVIVGTRVTGPGAATLTQAGDDPGDAVDGTATSDGVLRYFQVAVRAAGAGSRSGYTAVALPAEVSAPGRSGTPSLDYGPSTPAQASDPAVQTLDAFLDAYLAGAGELDRYLSPGTSLAAVSPAPYTSVQVSQVADHGADSAAPDAAADRAPADGAQRRLLVDVVATTPSGQRRPLTYAVDLRARAGRWEVAGVDAAPDLAASASAGPSTSSSLTPGADQ